MQFNAHVRYRCSCRRLSQDRFVERVDRYWFQVCKWLLKLSQDPKVNSTLVLKNSANSDLYFAAHGPTLQRLTLSDHEVFSNFQVDQILGSLQNLVPKLKSLTLGNVMSNQDNALTSALRPTKIRQLDLDFVASYWSEGLDPVIRER